MFTYLNYNYFVPSNSQLRKHDLRSFKESFFFISTFFLLQLLHLAVELQRTIGKWGHAA